MKKNCKESDILLNNRIDYGPIRFYCRRKKAPTLLTGRKSGFEELNGEQFQQRELRREKNRFLSKKLKAKREKIFEELLAELNQLEQSNFHLIHSINQLQSHKNHLISELENSYQQPFELFSQENPARICSHQQLFDQILDDTFLFDYLFSDQSQ